MDRPTYQRRLPIGAELVPGGGAHFRVWAPCASRVEVVFGRSRGRPGGRGSRQAGPSSGAAPQDPASWLGTEGSRAIALGREPGGYFSGFVAEAAAGAHYGFRLDDRGPFPDPASRFQPFGPHGPSELVDPTFPWTDGAWAGPTLEGAVLYEMHVGTFTPQGTWQAAVRHLPALAELGVTVLEIMPVAEFPGRFGWGYDGVCLFAPTRLYGPPDALRHFVDRAHAHGLAVILDVVYNHLGPDGNYLGEYSPAYFSDRYRNEWGEAINFDGAGSRAVREFFLANVEYWITEFHLDGYRLDATQQIFDASDEPIIAALVRRARTAAGHRRVLVTVENEPQDTRLIMPVEAGGHGADAIWNDDFHHTARVALTGRREAYYSDYLGSPQELISTAKRGFLYQGQHYTWQGKRRGTPTTGLPARAFIHYLENHDQAANSRSAERLHRLSSPGRYRALTALLLLGPATPLLFQGQEFGATSRFAFFADHRGRIAEQVRTGRERFMDQFPALPMDGHERIPDPCSEETFMSCKLDHGERERHAEWVALHRDLLLLRRTDPLLGSAAGALDGAVLGPQAFVLRFFGPDSDRLLLVNLGPGVRLAPAPEPLLAPPRGGAWRLVWSSDDLRYGGPGTPPLEQEPAWALPGEAAILLTSEPAAEAGDSTPADGPGAGPSSGAPTGAGSGAS